MGAIEEYPRAINPEFAKAVLTKLATIADVIGGLGIGG